MIPQGPQRRYALQNTGFYLQIALNSDGLEIGRELQRRFGRPLNILGRDAGSNFPQKQALPNNFNHRQFRHDQVHNAHAGQRQAALFYNFVLAFSC